MKLNYPLKVFAILLFTLSHSIGLELQNGDLAFVGASNSSFDEAISKATAKSTDYTHLGIIELESKNIYIIEAHPDKGVVRRAFKEFAKENKRIDIFRLKNQSVIADSIKRAKTYLGQPYDVYFLPNNDKMYCSELVYEAFLDKNNKHIFKANPMNFYAPDGSLPKYWKDLFASLGVEVPQNELGTNPNDLSTSKDLIFIGTYQK